MLWLAILIFTIVILAMIRCFDIYKVKGHSMSPAYLPDDYVVIFRRPMMRYEIGDVVVAEHPHYQTIVKRIAKLNNDNEVWLSGDNPQSTSSHALGWQTSESLLGKVVWHIRAPLA